MFGLVTASQIASAVRRNQDAGATELPNAAIFSSLPGRMTCLRFAWDQYPKLTCIRRLQARTVKVHRDNAAPQIS